MTTSELMIGDWVMCNGINLQVAAITYQVGFRDDDDKIYWCSDDGLDRIDPIPLTSEILEKNGFKKTILSSGYNLYDFEHFIIKWEKDFGYWFGDGEYTIDFNYVHQLQRLLNLCNIDKEIKL